MPFLESLSRKSLSRKSLSPKSLSRKRTLRAGACLLTLILASGLASCSSGTAAGPSPERPHSAGGSAHGAVSPTTTASGTSAPAGTSGVDWSTYHRDASRSGYDPSPAAAGRPAIRWSSRLDADSYAEPLVAGTTVVVATEENTVSALDSTTGAVRWSTNLGLPMPGSALACGDIDPSGITGTPVVDRAAGLVWAVAFVRPGRHDLVGLDLATGAIRSRRTADPPGASPLVEQQRGALALASGKVYVPFGGLYGDCGDFHGYVLGFDETGSATPLVYRVPSARAGGIWAPSGAAVGADGSLFVATGNSDSTSSFDGGDAVIRLSPDLAVLDKFAPANFAELNATDTDLGSTGPVLLAGGLVFQIGKSGTGYLLRAGDLGGIGAPAYSGPVCQSAYGATAAATLGGVGTVLVVPCTDQLVALRVGAGPRLDVLWRRSDLTTGPPVVTGSTVWAQTPTAGDLVAVDLATGSTVGRLHVGGASRFATPAAGGGQVYVVGGRNLVAVGGS